MVLIKSLIVSDLILSYAGMEAGVEEECEVEKGAWFLSHLILSYFILSYPILPYLILYEVVEKDKEGGDDINCIDCGKRGPDSEAIRTEDWPGPYCFECYFEECGCSNFASCE